MRDVLRIIDANANRAREALRVMEEAARFLLDDPTLTAAIKTLRHHFAQALQACPACQQMIVHRDTPQDTGTTITTPSEQLRTNTADVALAAGKRLSEALRSIEEYAKTLGVDGQSLAKQIEALRYQGYSLEQQLHQAMTVRKSPQWRLCVLITESLCPNNDWRTVAKQAIQGGADCLQLREKEMEAGQLYDQACELVALAKTAGVSIIINDRPDIALLSGAQGVHLGQDDLPCNQVRKMVGNQLWIGISTSSLNHAQQALRDGADYCGVGPMYPSTTKHKDTIVGQTYLKEYLAWNHLPHLAIGGITPQNLGTLLALGVKGVAVSSAICSASNPEQATKNFLQQFEDR